MYKHILLATDGSPCALKAACVVAELAAACASAVTIVYVQPGVQVGLSMIDASMAQESIDVQEDGFREEYDHVIDKTRAAFDDRGIPFDCIEARGFAGDVIPAVAAQCKADLIVVGHRGKNALQALFLGSTSERVAHNAKTSVLIVR